MFNIALGCTSNKYLEERNSIKNVCDLTLLVFYWDAKIFWKWWWPTLIFSFFYFKKSFLAKILLATGHLHNATFLSSTTKVVVSLLFVGNEKLFFVFSPSTFFSTHFHFSKPPKVSLRTISGHSWSLRVVVIWPKYKSVPSRKKRDLKLFQHSSGLKNKVSRSWSHIIITYSFKSASA